MTTITFRPMLEYPAPGWGEPINGEYCGEIAPHLAGALTLVVHRWPYGWRVSEIETGRRIGDPADARIDALRNALATCATRTVEDAERGLMTGPDWGREA